MRTTLDLQHWCSHRLSIEEFDQVLQPVLELMDRLETQRPLSDSLRALRQLVTDSNSVWLTFEAGSPRDYSHQTFLVQVIEAGRPVATCRLF